MALIRILMMTGMMLVRVLPFLIVAALFFLLWRRSARKRQDQRQDPDFQGPVYTVDYRVVEDEADDEGEEPPA